jgi:hypothetical protein
MMLISRSSNFQIGMSENGQARASRQRPPYLLMGHTSDMPLHRSD